MTRSNYLHINGDIHEIETYNQWQFHKLANLFLKYISNCSGASRQIHIYLDWLNVLLPSARSVVT